jgi:hypothetical protein
MMKMADLIEANIDEIAAVEVSFCVSAQNPSGPT